MLSKDGNGRPLLTPDFAGGPSSTVYGLTLWQTKGIAAGTALVADPAQIVVAIRSDPTGGGQLGRDFHCGRVDLSGHGAPGCGRQRRQRAGHHRRHRHARERGQVEQEVTDSDELPRDPDWDDVPEELRLLAGLDHGVVAVLCEDGVSQDTLVVVPALFAHARRLEEIYED